MTHGHNTSLFQINSTFRSDNGDRRASGKVTGHTYRNLHSQLDRICCGNLNLRFAADRSEDSYILDRTELQSYDGNCFIGCKLSAHQIFFLGKLIAFSEQCLHMLLCQVNMSCGNSDRYNKTIALVFVFVDRIDHHFCDHFNIIRFQEYTCFLSVS